MHKRLSTPERPFVQAGEAAKSALSRIYPALALIDKAVERGKNGDAVFPCNGDKTPACKHGCKDAVKDKAGIIRLFSDAPTASLIGVATGSPSGFDVLDIDAQHGGLSWYEENRHRIPETFMYRTKSGGLHPRFKHKNGLKNSVSRIALGVDVRTDGGSAIYWPAAGYEIICAAPPAEWPEWLLTLAMPPPRPVFDSTRDIPKGSRYAAAALRRAAESISKAGEGTRNHTLNREAFSMLRFAQTGELGADEIATALAQAALASGLMHHEIVPTLTSALRARGF